MSPDWAEVDAPCLWHAAGAHVLSQMGKCALKPLTPSFLLHVTY